MQDTLLFAHPLALRAPGFAAAGIHTCAPTCGTRAEGYAGKQTSAAGINTNSRMHPQREVNGQLFAADQRICMLQGRLCTSCTVIMCHVSRRRRTQKAIMATAGHLQRHELIHWRRRRQLRVRRHAQQLPDCSCTASVRVSAPASSGHGLPGCAAAAVSARGAVSAQENAGCLLHDPAARCRADCSPLVRWSV